MFSIAFVVFSKMTSGPYNYSYIFKYIIIGDMGVGKSCLLHQFTEKKCKSYCVIVLKNHGRKILVLISSFFSAIYKYTCFTITIIINYLITFPEYWMVIVIVAHWKWNNFFSSKSPFFYLFLKSRFSFWIIFIN